MKNLRKVLLGFALVGALAGVFWLGSKPDRQPDRPVRTEKAAALPATPSAAPVAEATPARISPLAGSAIPGEVPAATSPREMRAAALLATIPAGPFKQSLQRLAAPTRLKALEKLARLDPPKEDYASLRAASDGALYYVCASGGPAAGVSAASTATGTKAATATKPAKTTTVTPAGVPISAPPIRHSRPGAANVLYLDFNGATISGTRWNSTYGNKLYVARPFDLDGDSTTFSGAEQAAIVQIWERVAEDYSPFDVDVTTEEPATYTSTTGHALITSNTDANGVAMPDGQSGGVSFVEVFGDFDYATSGSPALIYYPVFAGNVGNIAEAVAHELGHNLGLSHDGTIGLEYYGGHGTGDISWGPIMGAPYSRNVTQWSKGEYYRANNTQDDIAIIAAHLSYRRDEAGATLATAAPASVTGATVSAAGVFTAATDVEVFSFSTGAGTISLAVNPYKAASGSNGGDADVKLELLNAAGTVVASADPAASTNASLSYKAKAGTYYARLTPAGAGSPLASSPSGYTNYGSLGQYTLTGTVVAASPAITSATAASIGAGQAFTYAIVATNSPTGYGATGLPAGLVFDAGSGVISGRATETGVFKIGLRASNASGDGTATLVLTVTSAAPAITAQSDNFQVLEPGGALTLSVSALSFGGTANYQWKHNGQVVAGATGSSLTVAAASVADSGFYQAFATNASGTTASALVFVRVAPASTQITAWGDNSFGQGNAPAGLSTAVAIAAGPTHVLALNRDGSVTGWGDNGVGQNAVPAGLTKVVAIAAGSYHSLALKADSTVVAWGYDSNGQGTVPAGLVNVVGIAAGYYHSLALKADGTVVAWGDNTYGQSTVPAGLAKVVAITAGRFDSWALKADGTLVGWGASSSGQLKIPAGLSGVVGMAAGAEHALALKSDGTVVAWGYNGFGDLPTGSGPIATVAAGLYHSLAINTSGAVVAWGYGGSGETTVPAGLERAIAISAGDYYSVALRDASGPAAPTITAQPESLDVTAGGAASFSVTATGSPAPTYRWERSTDGGATWTALGDDTIYSGASSATFHLATTTVAMSGDEFRCLASNAAQSDVASAAASLTVKPVNTAPTITIVADQTILSDTTTGDLSFAVGDGETAAAELTVGATSSNTVLVPAGAIEIGGTGGSRTVRVTPTANQTGTATIKLTVSDGALTTSSSFVLTVKPANTPPTITAIANQTINEDTPTAPLAFTIGDEQTEAAALTVGVASSNPALVAVGGIASGGSGANRTLTITPEPNQNGAATITLTVSDGVFSASSAFVLTVNAVNDAPTISGIANQSIATGGATAALAFTIGDVETAASSLTLTKTSSNTTLVPATAIVLGGSGPNRTVTVTPAAKQSGSATITLTVSDGALTASTSFVVTVTVPNTAPTITNIANLSVQGDASTATIAFTVGDAQTAAANLTVTASSADKTLVPDANILLGGSGASRTLRIIPAAGKSGSTTISVFVSDGSLSALDTFILTVLPVNHPPTISAIANQTILVGTSTDTLAFTIGDPETPAANLALSKGSSSTSLVPTAAIALAGTSANRTITVTPQTKVAGAATITLTVSDGALSASSAFKLNVVASNDAMTDAVTLNGATDRATAKNSTATKQAGEPNHAGNVGGHSVWWQWVAPFSGVVNLSTAGSTFNTLLAVYTGTAVNALMPVASDDNSGANLTSVLVFAAKAGTTYWIAVDGFNGASGSVNLSLSLSDTAAAALPPATPSAVSAKSSVLELSGDTVTVSTRIDAAAGLAGTSAHVLLPENWSYVVGSAPGAVAQPAVGDTDLLEWRWNNAALKSATFTFSVRRPPGETLPAILDGLLLAQQPGKLSGALLQTTLVKTK